MLNVVRQFLRDILHMYYLIIGIKILLKLTANLIGIYIIVFLILNLGNVVHWSTSYIIVPFIIQCIAAAGYVIFEKLCLEKAYNNLMKYEYNKDKE